MLTDHDLDSIIKNLAEQPVAGLPDQWKNEVWRGIRRESSPSRAMIWRAIFGEFRSPATLAALAIISLLVGSGLGLVHGQNARSTSAATSQVLGLGVFSDKTSGLGHALFRKP